MGLERSRLAAGVYSYVGDVGDGPLADGMLPLNLVFEVLTDIESELLRDLDLSDQNRRVTKTEVHLSSSTFTVNQPDFHAPAYAFLRADSSSDAWWPVEIVNHSSVMQAGYEGRLAVGFYGTPQQGEISWEPDSGQTLRLWYERSGDDAPLLSGEAEIGSLYDSHLKLQAAAQCRELMGLEVGPVLAARLHRGDEQWKRHVTMSRAQGTVAKTPVYTPARFRRSRYPADRTRFFIPR